MNKIREKKHLFCSRSGELFFFFSFLFVMTAAYAHCLAMRASTEHCHHQPQCVSRAEKTAARSPSASPPGEKSVNTHQHIRRAVNGPRDGKPQQQEHFVSDPLTATVYILYCSISHACHTCCLYGYQTIRILCPQKKRCSVIVSI